ncbi:MULTISPECIES: GNAT family N-acetyltransferase [unclassified Pseudoalteromonas]|uniref:GNAT family N-acetyltransferase n=1 Tax=Pseudoalteromonas sp. '520P1 No. 412' TaxID=304208 RepID=UPI000FDDEA0F
MGIYHITTENNFKYVEFRRIVVDSKGKGIGQLAIKSMELYCTRILQANRIWHDVFEANTRGLHIYQKLGYKVFKTENLNSKALLYMDKAI